MTMNMVIKRGLGFLLCCLMLSGCGAYSGKFTCPDAKGAHCLMLSQIDEQVNSGEIEKIYEEKKCFFGKCSNSGDSAKENRPPLQVEKF